MLVESKRVNPLSISLNSNKQKYLLLGENSVIPDYNLRIGCIIGTKNYGFNIITPNNKKSYYTQCPITAIEVKNRLLMIYEEGKYIPWKFSLDGNCINAATFLNISRKDVNYLTDKLSTHSSLLEQVNEEAYFFEMSESDNLDYSNYYHVSNTTLTINSNVKTINRQTFHKMFKNNKTIKEIVLNEGIEEIDAGTFSDFLCLTTLYIPKSLKNMALHIAEEKILDGLKIFYKGNKSEIKYTSFVNRFYEQKTPVIKTIDKLYSIFTLKDNVLHINKISRDTIDGLNIIKFKNIKSVVIEDDFVNFDNDENFINDFYSALNNISSFNKVTFAKSCSTIISYYMKYQYNNQNLQLKNEVVHPDLAKLIAKEIADILNVNSNDIFNLILNLLGKYNIYLSDEKKCCQLFTLGFIDVIKALKQYGKLNSETTYLPEEIIKKVTSILCGEEALIAKKNFIGGTIDLREYQNYLTFQKVLDIKDAKVFDRCSLDDTKVNMPPLALLAPNSFLSSTLNNVNFQSITPDSWQPTYIDNKLVSIKKELGSHITFKNNLYLELGRECNASCNFCMNKSFIPRKFDFNNIEESLKFLAPYLNDIFIGGGEPTLKIEYLFKLKKALKRVNPTIISNGSAPSGVYKRLWDGGINIGISRHAVSDDDNRRIFGVDKILSSNDLSELIEQQQQRRLTIFVTCMPDSVYSTESILDFINTFHKLGCNIIFQSPMLDKTLGDLNKIYDLETTPCHQAFTEVGEILSKERFSKSVPIIGTAGYRVITYEKFFSGVISFKEYITNAEYEKCWPYAIKRTFDLSINPNGEIYENWNGKGKKLSLNFNR